MAYEVKVFDPDEAPNSMELTVIEVAEQDSEDPDTIKLVVYAWRRDQ